VAVNCCVWPGRITPLTGESAIAVMVCAAGKNPPQLHSTIALKHPAFNLLNHENLCTFIVLTDRDFDVQAGTSQPL
jgi:hypothetical protein